MQNYSNGKINNNAVCVAVRIRPQNARERAENASFCVAVTPGEPQITIGRDRAFTYDYVFEENTKQEDIYNSCISGLLEGAFEGYNATVIAYGQTGSGKTYTMGTSFDATQLRQQAVEHMAGIIPRAAQHIFDGIGLRKKNANKAGHLEPSFEVFVQFIELYNEEIIDLLAEGPRIGVIKIQEDPIRNEINLRGTVWQPVHSAKDVMDALKAGAMNRTTAATNMNQQSSRSHAIFTVQLKQTRVVQVEADDDGTGQPSNELEVFHAKFHFVDLAGSERLKRTGATGDRAKEGISINSGLLALGNVISALGGGSGGGRNIHVPYRDSKLTRLLQDSLGGNSRTLMIACASPSDVDFVETLNTLHYANRAKNIKNRVVANQDKSSKLITEMRCRIVALEAELQEYKQGKRLIGEDGEELINDQYLENQQLQVENQRMRVRIKGLDETIEILRTRSIELQKELEMAKFRAGIVAGMENKENAGAEAIGEQQFSAIIEGYLQEMETLQTKLIEMNSINEALRKQNHHFRQQLEQQGMAVNNLTGSPYMPSGGTVLMSQNSLIKSAKAKIERQKKALFAASPTVFGDDDAHEEHPTDEEENDEVASLGEGEDDVDEEQANSQEHMRLYGEVAQLQEDINLKERLVQELETNQWKIEQMRQNYEKKLVELANRIQTTETERDNILAEMAAKKPSKKQKEEINKVREKYEKELANMRSEHRRLELAERQNKKMQLQQSRQQSECEKIKQELETLKRQKVDLMKQLKEEAKRMRQIQSANAQKTATLEKLQRQQQNKIIKLERETAMKTEYLKRKAEEMQRIKAQQKRRETIFEPNRRGAAIKTANGDQQKTPAAARSNSAANATFLVENPHIPLPQILDFDDDGAHQEQQPPNEQQQNVETTSKATTEQEAKKLEREEHKIRRTTIFELPKIVENADSAKTKRRSGGQFSVIQNTPIRTKNQWNAMERAIECLVNRKNAVAFEEQAMNRLIAVRHGLQDELAQLCTQSACTTDLKLRADIRDEQDALQAKLNYVQGEILKYQKNIVELEDQVIEFEPVNRRSGQFVVNSIPTLEEQTSVDSIESLVLRCSREFHIPSEAQYILRNLLDAVIQKGTELAKVQAENKEIVSLLGLDDKEDVREVLEARKRQQQQPLTPRLDPVFDTTFMIHPSTPHLKQEIKMEKNDQNPTVEFE